MSIRVVSSVYECFHPLELFLKLTGFLPIFWHAERHSTRQRIINWTNLVVNVVICLLVSHVGLKLEREHHIDGTNFARKIIINEVVTYVTPQTGIVLAFVMARRAKKIFHKLHQIDWEVGGEIEKKNLSKTSFLISRSVPFPSTTSTTASNGEPSSLAPVCMQFYSV